uniref:StAR related lipid transfer domain containing 13 n=1 Tax=Monodelphis domestica TaxID=13616 RepID=A0A5F8H2P9_MONDO
MTSKRKPLKPQLRRSISEQLRDSTSKAWDLLWKNVRERRLAEPLPEVGCDPKGAKQHMAKEKNGRGKVVSIC